MDTLRHLLLEDPIPLCIVAAATEAIFLLMYHLRRTRGWLKALAGPPAVALVVLVLSAVVETPRERIRATLEAICRAVEAGDLPAIADHVSARYADRRYHDRNQLLAGVEAAVREYHFREVRPKSVQIEVNGDTAVARFDTPVEMTAPIAWRATASWTTYWERQDKRWLITSAELTRPTGVPAAPGGP